MKSSVQSDSWVVPGDPRARGFAETPNLESADQAVCISGVLVAEKNPFGDGCGTGARVCCRGRVASKAKSADMGVWKFYDSVLFQFKVLIELSNADTVSQEHLYFIF